MFLVKSLVCIIYIHFFAASAFNGVDIKFHFDDGRQLKESFKGSSLPTAKEIKEKFKMPAMAVCRKNGKELKDEIRLSTDDLEEYSVKHDDIACGILKAYHVKVKNTFTRTIKEIGVCPKSTWSNVLQRLKSSSESFSNVVLPGGVSPNDIIPNKFMAKDSAPIELWEARTVPLKLHYVNQKGNTVPLTVAIYENGESIEQLKARLLGIVPDDVNVPVCRKDGGVSVGWFDTNDLVKYENGYTSHASFLYVCCPGSDHKKIVTVCHKMKNIGFESVISDACKLDPYNFAFSFSDSKNQPLTREQVIGKVGSDTVINVVPSDKLLAPSPSSCSRDTIVYGAFAFSILLCIIYAVCN